MQGQKWLLRSAFFQYNVYKRHDDHQVQTNIYIYIYINIDRGGTKTILGPAGALRAPAGKKLISLNKIFKKMKKILIRVTPLWKVTDIPITNILLLILPNTDNRSDINLISYCACARTCVIMIPFYTSLNILLRMHNTMCYNIEIGRLP